MTTKHTPGPWVIGTRGGHNASIVYSRGDEGVCQVYGIPLHRDIDEVQKAAGFPNAHLIAAAPDMYEALDAFAEEGEDLTKKACHIGICPPEICGRCSEVIAARKALAKARGEA